MILHTKSRHQFWIYCNSEQKLTVGGYVVKGVSERGKERQRMQCRRRSVTLWGELGCVNCYDTITGCDQQSNEIRAVSHTCLATSSWQHSSSLPGTHHKSQKESRFLGWFACADLTKWLFVIGQWSVTCSMLRTDRVAVTKCVLQLLLVTKCCFSKPCTCV